MTPASAPHLTIPAAARQLGVSEKHIRRLIELADLAVVKRSRAPWVWGRELHDVTRPGAAYRSVRIDRSVLTVPTPPI